MSTSFLLGWCLVWSRPASLWRICPWSSSAFKGSASDPTFPWSTTSCLLFSLNDWTLPLRCWLLHYEFCLQWNRWDEWCLPSAIPVILQSSWPYSKCSDQFSGSSTVRSEAYYALITFFLVSTLLEYDFYLSLTTFKFPDFLQVGADLKSFELTR